jgi:hypothetical protein
VNRDLIEKAAQRNRDITKLALAAALTPLIGRAGAGAVRGLGLVGEGALAGAKHDIGSAAFTGLSLPGAPMHHAFTDPLKKALTSKSVSRKSVRSMSNQIRQARSSRPPSPGSTRLASVKFSRADVEAAAKIYKQMEKSANMPSAAAEMTWKQLAKYRLLPAAVLGAAFGTATPLAQYGLGKAINLSRSARLSSDYNKMLEIDPALSEDPNSRRMFEVVHRASPYIAGEPVIAAATVRSMIDSPQLDERKFKQILDTEQMRQKTEMPYFQHGGRSEMPHDPFMGAP